MATTAFWQFVGHSNRNKGGLADDQREWSLGTRIAFRFACVFLLLMTIPFPFEYDDSPDILPSIWHRVVPWVPAHLSHFSQSQVLANLVLYSYFQLLTYVLIGTVVAVIWSIADRKRLEYATLHEWLRIYLRIYLAAMIFSYGSSKLYPEQFRPPSLARLLQPFGDYDPSGLMWNFMGVSRTYTLFAGAVEALAGILLFIPRLRTIGALLCGAALTNVLVLDIAYGVTGPRIFCFMLLLISGFLLAPDLSRLIDFFVLNRKVDLAPSRPIFRRRWLNVALLAIQIGYGVYIIGYNLAADRRNSHVRDQALLSNPLRGIWYVEEFQQDHEMHAPMVTDAVRWQRVVIDSPPSATLESGVIDLFTIQSMSGSLQSLTMQLDRSRNFLSVKRPGDSTWTGGFDLSQPAEGTLVLNGKLDGRQITATLHLTHPQFKLTSTGFRWLRDRPLDPWNP